MNALLEIHILQNFAPSNLNRDDTGSPKDCEFGGYRRARLSSQSLKRAMREYVRAHDLLPENALAVRTKRVLKELSEQLVAKGHDASEAEKVVELALAGLKLKIEKKAADDDDAKTQYLLFLGKQELAAMAQIIEDNWADLVKNIPQDDAKKRGKKDASKAVPKEVVNALETSLDGGKAVDLALFGRMLADLPQKNREAACQVAHALSTNAVQREFDFFTAVDDLKPVDNAGADMLGTVEFNSACYYRYIALDLHKLQENLQGDAELLEQGLRAFLQASYHAAPSGKQNSFAAHNPPHFFAVSVRSAISPRNLANAFAKPIRPKNQKSLNELSVEALEKQWQQFDEALGTGESNHVALLNFAEDAALEYLSNYYQATLSDVIDQSVTACQATL